MVRKLLILMFFVVGIMVLSISLWRVNVVSRTMAIDSSSSSDNQEVVAQDDSTKTFLPDYSFPYPGLLPDHPLYFIKMIRDRIQLWLTRDPVSRAKLLLEYADKRMAAALVLAEDGKSGLAVSTAMKASQYLERSALQVESLSDNSKVEELTRILAQALVKHKQVFRGIESRIPNEARGGLDDVRVLHEQVEDKVTDKLEAQEDEVLDKEEVEDVTKETDEKEGEKVGEGDDEETREQEESGEEVEETKNKEE